MNILIKSVALFFIGDGLIFKKYAICKRYNIQYTKMIDEYSYGIIKLQNGSPDWLRKFSLIPDEDERSHYVVYANVSQMLSQ